MKLLKRFFVGVLCLALVPCAAVAKGKAEAKTDRQVWTDVLYKMAAPVLENMSRGELQKNMQLELSPTWDGRNKKVSRRRHARRQAAQAAARVGAEELRQRR